ncbi:MAG: helix-turn-helix transcriptional regulator [Acidobacteria bacterium]|nr:helix-turn-helix transcriptional regulator [Acidobacteriota bacterium]
MISSSKLNRERLSAFERRSAILNAAIDLFSTKGFRGTTTREIAAAVGVS